jgi:hypothetical protein
MRKQLPKYGDTRIVTKYAYFPVIIYTKEPSIKIWLEKYKQVQCYEFQRWYNQGNYLFDDQEGIDNQIKELKEECGTEFPQN